MFFKKKKETIEKVEVTIEDCVGCGCCELACPVDAIKYIDNYPHINQEKCIGCYSCEGTCPTGAIKVNG